MRKLLLRTVLAALLPATSAHAATLYAPDYSANTVHALEVGPGGAAAPIPGSPFDAASGGLNAFATTPDGRKGIGGYFFTANGGVRGFSIGAGGEVTAAQPKISNPANGVYSIAVSPDSRFAYVGTRNYPGPGPAGIRVYAFSDDGALTEIAGSPFGDAWEIGDVALTPDGRYLYAAVGMGLLLFAVNADGSLTMVGPTGGVVAYWAMASPDGRFLFVGGEDSGKAALSSFAISADGSLAPLGSPVVFGGGSPQLPGLTPDGRYLYMPEQNDAAVHTARVNPDGTLAYVGSLTGVQARSPVASPDSKWLYMWVYDSDNTLARSPIGPDGVPGPYVDVAPYDPGEDVRMHFRTGFGGVAQFTAKPAAKRLTMNFNGSRSTARQGALGSLDWSFGDGAAAVDGGATPSHEFAKPGVYEVTLVARDSGGCGSERIFLGQTAPCMGSPEATKTVRIDTPPWITSLKVAPRRVGKRTKIRYSLTERARVTFFAQRRVTGRMVGKKCRKPSRANRRAKKCALWLRASKSFRHNGRKGRNVLKFDGHVGRKRLAAHSYRLNAVAVDRAKGKSPVKTAPFKVR